MEVCALNGKYGGATVAQSGDRWNAQQQAVAKCRGHCRHRRGAVESGRLPGCTNDALVRPVHEVRAAALSSLHPKRAATVHAHAECRPHPKIQNANRHVQSAAMHDKQSRPSMRPAGCLRPATANDVVTSSGSKCPQSQLADYCLLHLSANRF